MAIELTTTNAEVKVEGTEALTTLTVNQAEVTLEVAQSGPQGVGVPAAGTTGQVLAKASNDDYDTEWVTGGGGVTDHGALTGLADDDHKQYQRAEPVFTTTDPYVITDESFVITTGAAITLPDAEENAGRTILIASGNQAVIVSPAGTDTLAGVDVSSPTSYTFPFGGVAFTSANIAGNWVWIQTNRQGPISDVPIWYAQGLADGNLITLQSGVPAWTTGTRTAEQFLSGTGWTDDVPVLVPVKNTTASTIAKGTPVYATGTVGSTSTIEIAPADADDAATMPAIGLTETSLAANATGYVTVLGTLRGLNTAAYSINQALYVSTTAGQLTETKPTGASELIQNVGRVTRVNANNGEILVLGPGRTNDVPNAIDAGKLTSGTVATARLGTGTADATTYLRGDQTWQTVAGASERPPSLIVAGQYVTTSMASTGNAGLTTNRLYYAPIYVTRTTSFDRIGITHAATTAGAGSVVRLGIYNSTNDLPSTLVLDAGTVDLTTAAAYKEVTISPAQSLSPGVYWLAAVAQITSGSPTFNTGYPIMPVPSNNNTFTGTKFEAGVSGTLPATATPGASNATQPPVIFLRAVP